MSMLDHVVVGEHVNVSINRKSGGSSFVVVVECSPHAAKLPHMINRLSCSLGLHRLQSVASESEASERKPFDKVEATCLGFSS